MADRAIFLDRDNTIIENDGYLGEPSKVKLLPGAATALASLRQLGYKLIVVSNQAGVARGMFDEAAVDAVNREVGRQLKEQAGAYIDASYYCPYHPEAPLPEYRVDHDWRKPGSGMLKQAAVDFRLDLTQCWMIGDQYRDVGAGLGAGVRTILLKNADLAPANEPAGDENGKFKPHFVVKSLADAARIIVREGKFPPPAVPPASPPRALVPRPAPPVREAESAPLPPVPPVGGEKHLAEGFNAKGDIATAPVAVAASESPGLPSGARVKADVAPVTAPAPAPVPAPVPVAAPSSSPATLGSTSAALARLEKALDELVLQLRAQARNADLQPDFSYSDMLMLIVQIGAAAALLLGFHAYFTAPTVQHNETQDYFNALYAHQAAIIWLVGGVLLQGMVIAMLMRKRRS